MLGELFSSIGDYTKTRLKNPFLGTIIFVWIVRNFSLLFALFNFDEGKNLAYKIAYINSYFKIRGIWDQFNNVWIAFLLFIASFIFLLIARGFTNMYSMALNYINNKTDKGQVVSKIVYASLEKQFMNLKTERDQLRTESRLHDDQIKDLDAILNREINTSATLLADKTILTKKLEQFQEREDKALVETAVLSSKISDLENDKETLKTEIKNLNFQIDTKNNLLDRNENPDESVYIANLYDNAEKYFGDPSVFTLRDREEIIPRISNLINLKHLRLFIDSVNYINNNSNIPLTEFQETIYRSFVDIDLLNYKPASDSEPTTSSFNLTPLGHDVYNILT